MTELNEPVEAGNSDSNDTARLDGIVEQVKHDLQLGHADDAFSVIRQRVNDAGIDVSDDELRALVERTND